MRQAARWSTASFIACGLTVVQTLGGCEAVLGVGNLSERSGSGAGSVATSGTASGMTTGVATTGASTGAASGGSSRRVPKMGRRQLRNHAARR
jgi:hypothetical protein